MFIPCLHFIYLFSGDFSWVFFFFFLWDLFLCLPTLADCICFYVLHRSVVAPSLCGVALCTTYPVVPMVWSPWSPELGASGVPFMWVMWAFCWNWVLFGIGPSCMGSTLRLADCEVPSWPWCMNCCARADHVRQNLPYQSLVPASLLLDMLLDPALMSSEAGYWVCWFRVFWEGLWRSPMSGAALDWSWEPLLEQSRCGFFCIFLVMRLLFG